MTTSILTCDEVRACELRTVAAGVSMGQLMERAGTACALALEARYPEGRVVVLAGPGNNGGDAFVAARVLAAQGREVVLHELAPGGPRSAEGAAAAKAWTGAHAPLEDLRVAFDQIAPRLSTSQPDDGWLSAIQRELSTLVIIRKQDTAETGDIVVALIDDEEATLKRLRKRGASIALEAANPAYETRVLGPDRVKIQGRLVGLLRRY